MADQNLGILKLLDPGSGNGNDKLPARILKECAQELAWPITILIMRIIAHMKWPESWKVHWIVPLHKRGAVFRAQNYRGVHLKAEITKVCERVVKQIIDKVIPDKQGIRHYSYDDSIQMKSSVLN